MTMTRVDGAPILTPEQISELLVEPVTRLSVAAQVSNVVHVTSSAYRIPKVTADPSAAWTGEGEEIPVSDAELDELTIIPSKIAGLSIITSELAQDSTPEAAEAVGAGLARDIAAKVDAAYFGTNVTTAADPEAEPPVIEVRNANQPRGLADLAGVMTISTAWTNLDPFVEATYAAEEVGATLRAFVANPADAAMLAVLKESAGSARALLGPDPARPTGRVISGVPLLTSPAVTEGTIWGIPDGLRAVLVIREGGEHGELGPVIEADTSPFFTSDRVAVRAKLRVGFGWPHPAAVVRLKP